MSDVLPLKHIRSTGTRTRYTFSLWNMAVPFYPSAWSLTTHRGLERKKTNSKVFLARVIKWLNPARLVVTVGPECNLALFIKFNHASPMPFGLNWNEETKGSFLQKIYTYVGWRSFIGTCYCTGVANNFTTGTSLRDDDQKKTVNLLGPGRLV